MNQLFNLNGRRALITGASSGIGSHFARVLADAGADVMLAARRKNSCEQLAEEIKKTGRQAIALEMDVRDGSSVNASVEQAIASGPIHILCNNAGVVITKSFLDHEEQDWNQVLDTNLNGAYRVARAVARQMADQGEGGTIINTASMLSFRVGMQLASYVTSKAALMQLTRAMAVELARYDIRVNAIAPGYILTDFNRDYFSSDAGQATVKRVPQRRIGNLEDLDGALLLLASDASRYMTGSAIVVDGGHSVNPV